MFRLPKALHLLRHIKTHAGFTMIELLIVISILGILAVAVLSAINPVEQINRGRDTGNRSDAEQLLSGIDRYYAFQGYAPWKTSPNAPSPLDTLAWTRVDDALVDSVPCTILEKLSQATSVSCVGSDELKTSFTTRIKAATYNSLYVYNRGTQGDSTYVCFQPKSGAFKTEALRRCTADGTAVAPLGLPVDLQSAIGANSQICDATSPWICLP